MTDRDCEHCKHHTADGCSSWDCNYERAMTREEAIHTLNLLFVPCATDGSKWGCKRNEALDMAIEALKREARFLKDFENNTPTGLISRADAIDAVHKYFVEAFNNEPHEIDEDGDDVFTDMKSVNALLHHNKYVSKALKALPSADRPSEERLLQEIKHLKEQNSQLSELYTALSVNTKGDNE